jgi:protein import protein ZIM17
LLAAERQKTADNQRQLLQDATDETVFYADPKEFKDINILMNPDGSFTFSSESGSKASTRPTHATGEAPKAAEPEAPAEEVKIDDPRMIMGMKCDECNTRLVKTVPKRSYEKGVVLIRCDGCKANHLIADHLGWFDDGGVNIEMIMREKGEEAVRVTGNEELDEATMQRVQETMRVAREQDAALAKEEAEPGTPKQLS